ncbi:MAG: RNA polymerase sigma factor [Myxococcales bacterium]|nr:RNA polymerase sigma factor [Myxococcales bacterium]
MSADLSILMKRYCEGDPRAFEELYAACAPKLLRYLVRLCGEGSTAEDLLQLSFIKVHKARASYVEGAAPLPWMYTICHRTFLDEARKRKRSKVIDVGGDVPEQSAAIDGRPVAASEPSENGEKLTQTLEALQSLPPSQRQAVILTKLDGKTMKEAAYIAGTSIGAMKVRAHRGYAALRKTLAGAKS